MTYTERVGEEEGVDLGLAGLSNFSSPWGTELSLVFGSLALG